MKAHPPKRALQFLRWFCREDYLEEIEGDLTEIFQKRCEESPQKAKWEFTWRVMKYLRPEFLKPLKNNQINSCSMLKSYFKIGWRNLARNKAYSFINIGGLTIGMSVALLIALWVHDELEFNKYHKNYESIGQVLREGTLDGVTHTSPSVPYRLGEELKSKYGASFKHIVVAWNIGDHILSAGEKNISFPGEFMDWNGVEMFSLNLVEGSGSVLKDPHSILLSQSTATLLFGQKNPLGKLIRIDNQMDVKVTGVYEDLPANTSFHGVKFFAPLDLLVSHNGWIPYQGFGNNFVKIYVSLAEHTGFENASSQIKNAILDNIQNDKVYVTINPQLFLHPMEKWHLWGDWKDGVNGGTIQIVWLFGIVGIFVLLLACINFMNLSTARSEKRTREVGVRKAIGSMRAQLVSQFFSESFLVVLIAFAFAVGIVALSLGWFNALASKHIAMPFTDLYFWLGSLAFIFITGLLAGSYPALYLSSINSIRALKGSTHIGRFASWPRKVLVVLQFTVSVVLVIGTTIIYKQIQHAKNRDVGYDREGLVLIQKTSPEFQGKYETLRNELKATGAIIEMAECSSPPTDIWNSNGGFNWEGKDPALIPELATFTVTPDYGKTIGWQVVQGRDFNHALSSDSSGFVINESAAILFGFADPIGKEVQWQSWWTNGIKNFTILGVIKDQVMTSPFGLTKPSVFFLGGSTNWMSFRLQPGQNTAEALGKIETVFKKILPTVPFDYKFADQLYALKFASDERIGQLAALFSALAILISCLGLFGLASFVAEQRTKEIGIRKVVGASIFQLWSMLSKDFVILVVISCVIAVPLAYYFLATWLLQFEYRTALSWWLFAAACFSALVITLLTVTYQSIRAAMVNPVKSLRSE